MKRSQMPHDIIDNHIRELAPEISNFLTDSIRAHFAVGYFFLSGFQAIAEHIPHLDQLRLLIGTSSFSDLFANLTLTFSLMRLAKPGATLPQKYCSLRP